MLRTVQALIIGLTVFPITASALTADELRTQVNTLLAQIQALQAQIATQGGGGATVSAGSTPAPAGSCPRVSRVLQNGDSGADVTRLQQFLALDPSVYPEMQVTGYFGSLTEAAVRRFQCKNKIVCDGDPASTGYGVVGPRTAAILALQCPDGGSGDSGSTGQVSGFIKVSPTVGVSPLSVSVDATVNTARSCAAQVYQIDFGDGATPVSVYVPANRCSELQQVLPHVYQSGGIYQVLLRAGTHQVSATVNVTQGNNVTTTSSDTLNSSPTSGATPLTVTFSGTVNASGVCNAGPYSIDFGDGQTASIALSGCTASSFQVPHTYSTSGTYTARLYRGTPAVSVASVVIQAGGAASTTGGPFSIEAGANGNPMTVRARFDIASTCSRFELNWGDGSTPVSQAEGSCGSGISPRDMTHTYQNTGSYTVTLKRGSSLTFVDTAGITISR